MSEHFIGTLNDVLHFETFLMVCQMPQSELVCKSYSSHKLTYLVGHHGTSGCKSTPITHIYRVGHLWIFKKILEGPNLITD
jgi:hypothetical protein